MPLAVEMLLENVDALVLDNDGNIGNGGAHTELLRDLQCNILTAHQCKRVHYFFVRFRDPEQQAARRNLAYLLGMLARGAFERLMVRQAIENPAAKRLMSPRMREITETWEKGAPAHIKAEEHELLREVRVMSEYEIYLRRVAPSVAGRLFPAVQDCPVGQVGYPVNVLLTARGYRSLGISPPNDMAFCEGMRQRAPRLNDPPPERWEDDRRWQDVDALVVLAYDPADAAGPDNRQRQTVETFKKILKTHAELLFEEVGNAIEVTAPKTIPDSYDPADVSKANPKGETITYRVEHFGFRDGISQPAFYQSQLAGYAAKGATSKRWSPFAPLSLALVPDPHGRSEQACGSYIVFRKLEQHVERFCTQTAELAEKLGLPPEQLRARLIGRKRNGQPLVASHTLDDFDYSEDTQGERCPYYAHARKTNPRSDVRATYSPRARRIVRRGITYGVPIDRDVFGAPKDDKVQQDGRPVAGRLGLLFLCAQGDIEQQFEHLQAQWANRPDHPRGRPSGADPVIGQSEADDKRATFRDFDYESVASLRGGEYFYAPSISFLRGLLDDLLS